jgi:hypothetical protein
MPTTRYALTLSLCHNIVLTCHQWGGATYDSATGWCTQTDGNARIAGKEWEAACRSVAQGGFGCVDGQGWCYAAVSDVRGRC